eukprot:TRINITY_DN3249_c0_g1_i2.p1 TRINITY_DN3249_c0_g1~~TRINITY_DN3249_c0_g1_i2.p1  ORF type:complete len:839 (-),score=229.53 TRINITY_DN3249_c0_g1_i2:1038-3554(-)
MSGNSGAQYRAAGPRPYTTAAVASFPAIKGAHCGWSPFTVVATTPPPAPLQVFEVGTTADARASTAARSRRAAPRGATRAAGNHSDPPTPVAAQSTMVESHTQSRSASPPGHRERLHSASRVHLPAATVHGSATLFLDSGTTPGRSASPSLKSKPATGSPEWRTLGSSSTETLDSRGGSDRLQLKRPNIDAQENLSEAIKVLHELKAVVNRKTPLDNTTLNALVVGECPGLEDVLTRIKANVTLCTSGPEALKLLSAADTPVNMIFCDTVLAKTTPATFVSSVMSTAPLPVIMVTMPTRPAMPTVLTNCVIVGAASVLTLPTQPDVLKIVVNNTLHTWSLSQVVHTSVTSHAKLFSQLSKILMEQDLYVRSLTEHTLLLQKYKKQAEAGIQALEKEVEMLNAKQQASTVTQDKLRELKAENAAMRWKRACDLIRRSRMKEVALSLPSAKDDEVIPTGPLEVITKTVRKLSLIDQFLDKEDLRNVLISVVKQLANKEWYTPEMKNMDGMTQMWVQTTFGPTLSPTSSLQPPVSGNPAGGGGDGGNEQRLLSPVPRPMDDGLDKRAIYSWNFPAFEYTHEQLVTLTMIMFHELKLVDEFKISGSTLLRFINACKLNYRPNPYHNFKHAIDVLQVCFMFLKTTKLRELLLPVDSLVLMVSAICHDLEHPGLNNNFQINAKTSLAVLYNDVSVLENHHCCLAFQILSKQEENIFVNLESAQWQEVRHGMISAILATDMTKHFELVGRFKSYSETAKFHKERKDERQLLLEMIVHAADISNLTRPQPVSRVWSDLLFEEYLQQGDEEKRLGLPVSPYMDRDHTDQVKMSINFVDFIGACPVGH